MEWTALASGLVQRDTLINQSNDPRIGSGRENATGGTLSHVSSSGTNSSSASSLGSTFVPVLIYSGICICIFLFLRRHNPRIYASRTLPDIRNPEEQSPPLPNGWFNWIRPFCQINDAFVLNHCSLDGYFFLRFLRVMATICGTGCIIAWPILLAVNGTGGNKLNQLDLLTIGNIAGKKRFYAHVFVAYIFFGFILFMVCRECVFYINLRQAYLLAPHNAHRLSERTVLFTCVPKRFRDEQRIRKLFGDVVKNVWIPRNTRALNRLVEERENTAIRLEKAEIDLIKKANAARRKALGLNSKGKPSSPPTPGNNPSSSSSSSSSSSPSSTSSPSSSPATQTCEVLPTTNPHSSIPMPQPPQRSATSHSAISRCSASTSSSSSSSASTSVAPEGGVRRVSIIRDDGSRRISGPPPAAVLKGRAHEEVISVGRHGSVAVSEATTTTPSATLVGAPSEAADRLEEDDDFNKDNSMDVKPIDYLGEEEDNEEDYIHPYGYGPNLPDLRGSVAAQWLPAEKRPFHRPLANYGRRVDTIRWSRMRLKTLNQNIARTRRKIRNGDGDALSALFVEFDSQASAQMAFQILAHHQPLHMSPRFIGIRPQDIIWSSLRMLWWERIIRRFFGMGIIAAGIIFWSIPSAFVGIVSNVEFLSTKVFFLKWISDLPGPITGVIQGLLPALALSLLMAAVPFMLRYAARMSGIVSVPAVELFTQHAYFIFQVVQVFLVTTLTSAASAAFTQILEDPLSIKDLLSKNLPKASNFYLSYITVQCLAGGSSGLVHLFDIYRFKILSKSIEHPRRRFRIWHTLKQPHWGAVFPVFTNMGVIAISYTCIAPLILAFACVGMCVVYAVYRYNLLYTFDTDVDSKGLHYPRALMHLLVGLYLAEICLIGLFSIQAAIGPVIMMVMFCIFTLLVHISINDAVSPLLYNLPRTLALEDKDLAGNDRTDAEDRLNGIEMDDRANSGGGLAADYYDLEEGYGAEDDEEEANLHAGPVTTRGGGGRGVAAIGGLESGGLDGTGQLLGLASDWGREKLRDKFKAARDSFKQDTEGSWFAPYLPWISPPVTGENQNGDGVDGVDGVNNNKRPNFFMRWLHPEVYEDYTYLRKLIPKDIQEPEYPPEYYMRGYLAPEMWKPIPRLWIPRDEARVSRQEVDHTREFIPITDRGTYLASNGSVVADLNKAPFLEPRIRY